MRVFNALTDPAAPDKTKMPHMGHFYFILVGAAGFEPTLTESESGVLPLNYAPSTADYKAFLFPMQAESFLCKKYVKFFAK